MESEAFEPLGYPLAPQGPSSHPKHIFRKAENEEDTIHNIKACGSSFNI